MPDPLTLPILRAVVATYAEIEDAHIAAGKPLHGFRWEAFHHRVFTTYVLAHHSHRKDAGEVEFDIRASYAAFMETPEGAPWRL